MARLFRFPKRFIQTQAEAQPNAKKADIVEPLFNKDAQQDRIRDLFAELNKLRWWTDRQIEHFSENPDSLASLLKQIKTTTSYVEQCRATKRNLSGNHWLESDAKALVRILSTYQTNETAKVIYDALYALAETLISWRDSQR